MRYQPPDHASFGRTSVLVLGAWLFASPVLGQAITVSGVTAAPGASASGAIAIEALVRGVPLAEAAG